MNVLKPHLRTTLATLLQARNLTPGRRESPDHLAASTSPVRATVASKP